MGICAIHMLLSVDSQGFHCTPILIHRTCSRYPRDDAVFHLSPAAVKCILQSLSLSLIGHTFSISSLTYENRRLPSSFRRLVTIAHNFC
jgi:hypothetical protein